MEALRNAAAQAQRIWQQSSRGNQIAIVLLAMASIAAVGGVGIWSSQPQYVPVASGLTTVESGEIGALLEGASIQFQPNYNGSVVSVPKADLAEALRVIGDKMPGAVPSDTLVGGSILETPGDQVERHQRQTERRLANTIARSPAIDEARVHISHSETGPFLDLSDEPAKASVTLTIAKGYSVDRGDAESIAKIVAHGAKNVSIENVTVIDAVTMRNLLSSGGLSDQKLAEQLAYRDRIERDIEFSAARPLQFLGPGKVIISATADIDFQEQRSESESIDPDTKVLLKERTESESGTGTSAGGRTGLQANAGATRAGSTDPYKKESSESEFDFAKTRETITAARGRIRRISIAATVDLSAAKDQAGQPLLTIDAVKDHIIKAAGLDEARGDTISVLDAPLVVAEAEPVEEVPSGGLDSYTGLLQNLSLGLASILAFVFGFMTLRRFKPISVPAPTAASIRKDQLVGEISAKAQDDPDAVSRIVAAWLNEPAPGGPTAATDETGEAARAAA